MILPYGQSTLASDGTNGRPQVRFRGKLSRQKLRAAVSEGPVLVRVRHDRYDDVGRWNAARPLQLAAEQLIEGLLCFPLSWSCRDLNDDAFARPLYAESGVLHDEVCRWMLVNDLVPITLRNLEGCYEHAMRGIKELLDLVGAATFDHVEPNERHKSSSSIARLQPGPLAPVGTITDLAK